MKKISGYSLAIVTAMVLLTGCSSKEDTLMKIQDSTMTQMKNMSDMQKDQIQRLEKENKMLKEKIMKLEESLTPESPTQN